MTETRLVSASVSAERSTMSVTGATVPMSDVLGTLTIVVRGNPKAAAILWLPHHLHPL